MTNLATIISSSRLLGAAGKAAKEENGLLLEITQLIHDMKKILKNK